MSGKKKPVDKTGKGTSGKQANFFGGKVSGQKSKAKGKKKK